MEDCSHRLMDRAGIQRFPVPPFRLYLLHCRACGTTLSTHSLRIEKPRRNAGLPDPAPVVAYSSSHGIGQ